MPSRTSAGARSRTSAAPRRSPAAPKLTVVQALALGTLQGPAELLPISSSAHTSATAWLLGWAYDTLEPELRKSFEVALHAGTATALLISLRSELLKPLDRRRALVIGLACAPPAIAGYVLEEEIERTLGSPPSIAVGLLAGSVAMTLADRQPQQRRGYEAGIRDALWLGLAQASALVPGVSRAGSTRSVARWRRFYRADAALLSDEVGLPVLAGASLLKAIRLSRRGLDSQLVPVFAAGAAASFVSTLVCAGFGRRRGASERLLPYAVYRAALAVMLYMRLRRASTAPRG